MIPAEWLLHAPTPNSLQADQKWHVFLSYRSVNRGWVLNLYDLLSELKFKVFLDQCVLIAGDRLTEDLERGLAGSQAGVLIWSNATKDSQWVRNEYEAMIHKVNSDKRFRFVPVKIEQAPLPLFANSRLFMDFTDYPDGPNGGELLRLLHGIVGKPLSDEAVHFAWEQDEAAGIGAVKISAAIRNSFPDKLIELYTQGGLAWKTTAALACKVAEGLIKLGREDDAVNMLTKIEKDFPKSVRPQQLKALALARRGKGEDLAHAQTIAAELYEAGHLDPETLGIYGRTWMDRYNASPDKPVAFLRQSRNYYAQAFEMAPDDYYTGINAASKSIFLHEWDEGKKYAEMVEIIVGTQAIPGDYWQTATVAEVLLLKREWDLAGDMYQKAVDMEPTARRSHESTYKQALLLLDALGPVAEDQAKVLRAFAYLITSWL